LEELHTKYPEETSKFDDEIMEACIPPITKVTTLGLQEFNPTLDNEGRTPISAL
jgi:hypothetical protein